MPGKPLVQMGSKRVLVWTAFALWALLWVDTIVAVWRKHPYGPYAFGSFGQGNPNDVLGDFMHGNGTALSPPLYLMVLFTLLVLLAGRRNRTGTLGVAGLGLLAVLFFGGYLIEPITPRVLAPNHVMCPESALIVLSLAGSVLMAVLAGRELQRRFGRVTKKSDSGTNVQP
jgi:hypothetical protein